MSAPAPPSELRAGPRRRLRWRHRGHRGGTILPHRAMRSLRLPWQRVAAGLATAAGFSVLLLWLQPLLAAAWSELLLGWLAAVPLPGERLPAPPAARGWALAVPQVRVPWPAPGPALWAPQLLALAAAAWASCRLPDRALPLAWLLRAALLVHALALLRSGLAAAGLAPALAPGAGPGLPGDGAAVAAHIADGLQQAWALMLLTPWLHLVVHSLFPVAQRQRLLLTGLTLLHMALLAPMQYACHAVLLACLGPVALPLLQSLGGLLLPLLAAVAWYGWAMGWRQPAVAFR